MPQPDFQVPNTPGSPSVVLPTPQTTTPTGDTPLVSRPTSTRPGSTATHTSSRPGVPTPGSAMPGATTPASTTPGSSPPSSAAEDGPAPHGQQPEAARRIRRKKQPSQPVAKPNLAEIYAQQSGEKTAFRVQLIESKDRWKERDFQDRVTARAEAKEQTHIQRDHERWVLKEQHNHVLLT